MRFIYVNLLTALILLCSPIFIHSADIVPKEIPYYQTVYEKHIITVNLGVQASLRVSEFGDDLKVYPSMPFNVEVFYRYTSPNVFGYGSLLLDIPFFNRQISNNFYGAIFFGIGWYVFDKRDAFGLGWSQMMALAGGFYMINNNLGGGARLASRWNYSFHKRVALNLGIDLDYAGILFDGPTKYFYIGNEIFPESLPLYHIINLGFTIGFTFYIN